MATQEYKLADVGEGLTEAEIVSWKVKVGDVIKVNDIVVEIETAKSLVELPSPYAGTVIAILVPEGETVPVGTPLISVSDGVAEEAAPAPLGEIDLSNPAATGGGENQTLVGYGPKSGSALRRARRGPATAATDAGAATQIQVQGTFEQPGVQHTTEVVPANEPPVPAAAASRETGPVETRVLAKPPVRYLAKQLGIDLRSVTPTGPGGTVTRGDVEGAGAAPATTAPAPAGAVAADRREPIKGVRKMMGQAMVQSAFTIPHVTEWITVDVTRTMEFVERLKTHRDFRDVKVSPLLVLAKAVTVAMRRTPEINAWWDDEAQEIAFRSAVNLGIAAATPRGLVVPNVKGAESLSLLDLARALGELTATAREGKTQPAEMAGGSFTITNVGVFGVDAGTPIINPGESAIIAFGAVRKQPWVVDDEIVARDITTLALSFDHRFIDGALGSRFLADVASILEDPAAALLF
ncbi:MAG TPA: dihydrolipoamide acetyltransferase family protein [Nocardioidaceae bacterium]|nr:dihydrolipoamide acetyltransferase family protein [Nocardioidaceae bacterium]